MANVKDVTFTTSGYIEVYDPDGNYVSRHRSLDEARESALTHAIDANIEGSHEYNFQQPTTRMSITIAGGGGIGGTDNPSQDPASPISGAGSITVNATTSLGTVGLFVGPAATGDGSGVDASNRRALENLPVLIAGDVVSLAQGDYTTSVTASVPIDYDYTNFQTREVGLFLKNTTANEQNPIKFIGEGTGPVFRGADSANSLEFGLYVENCDWIEFINIHADGSRNATSSINPNLRMAKLGVLLDSTNITMDSCSFVRCNVSRGFMLMRSDLCHVHDSTFQYCGHPDKFQDADPYSADDLNIDPQNPDVGDLFTTDETSKYNLIEDCNISFGGHVPVAAHGEYNIFRRIITDNSWPTAEFGTMNVQSPHPFLSRAFLNGRPFGNRHASTRGGASNGGFSGRNVLEHFTVLNAEEAVDAGQLVRIAGSNSIYRFNTVQIASSTNDGMGNTGTSTNPERHAYSCEIYNNEYIDIDDFRGYGDRGFNRTVGGPGAGCAWNRNYNNAHGAFNAGAYQYIAEMQNSDWPWVNANHPNIGDNSHPTLTSSWSHNVFAHNTFADADTALSIEVPTGGFGTIAAVQARSDGVTENHVFGNQGGQFKRADGGMAHAQTTNSGTNSTGPIELSTTNPFVAFNLYLQLASDEGDQVVINGQTTRITSINEATKEITVSPAITWTSGTDVVIASVVTNAGTYRTGIGAVGPFATDATITTVNFPGSSVTETSQNPSALFSGKTWNEAGRYTWEFKQGYSYLLTLTPLAGGDFLFSAKTGIPSGIYEFNAHVWDSTTEEIIYDTSTDPTVNPQLTVP